MATGVETTWGRTMTRYEYKIVEGKTQADIERAVNELAKAG